MESAAELLPRFKYLGVILDYEDLRYRPHPDVIHPTVVETSALAGARAKYYMYYAPHDRPGGICLAYAGRPEGPWTEYESNPIIGREWLPHYTVSHVSSPHALWNPEAGRLFLYFHGENSVTRFAHSVDGIHFEYGGTAVHTDMFEPDVTEASYARVFRLERTDRPPRYIMLVMGNHRGTRKVYYAESADGASWTARKEALIQPPPGYNQMGPGSLFPWQDRLFIILFANRSDSPPFDPITDLYVYEVDPEFREVKDRGKLLDHTVAGPTNSRINDPAIVWDGSRVYMFVNVGRRLNQKIALAIADLDA